MTVLSSVLSAVFWGLLVLSLLVFLHEGGHFLLARLQGVRVTEFYLGLPFRYNLHRKSKRFGTDFGVTPILLGGYNRICGMEGEVDELLPSALAAVQRKGRITGAELAEELSIDESRAYALLAYLTDMASIRPYYNPSLGEVPWQNDWPEAFETLERDAKMLTEYDSDHDFSEAGTTAAGAARPVEDAQGFFNAENARTYRGKGLLGRLAILVAGPLVNIALAFFLVVGSLMIAGVEVYPNSNELGGVVEGSLAEAAGLREGDVILQLGGTSVSSWDDLCDAIDKSLERGGDIQVAYERNGETFETTIVVPEGQKVELIGVNALVETYHPSLGEATGVALNYMKMVGSTVVRIIMPQHTMEVVSQSSSIVGISTMAADAAKSGPNDLVLLIAAVSISLGFMNLLPIPPLDGGKILIEFVQAALRRPISAKTQAAISYVGLAFFLFIFCFALRNDIVSILG